MKATPQDFTKTAALKQNLLQLTDWAVISACKSELSREENESRTEDLISDLYCYGIEYERVEGKYGVEEPSILCYDIDARVACNIGERFDQESVLTRHGLIYMEDGQLAPANGISIHETKPADFWTEVPRTGLIFTVEIDFSGRA